MPSTYKRKITKKKVFCKCFCTKEDGSSWDEYEVGESDTERVLLMTIENFDKEDTKEEYEEA